MGIFDGLFGGGGNRETILPTHTQAQGYGGSYHNTQSSADKSCLTSQRVFDSKTGQYGTGSELYDYYKNQGYDTSEVMDRFNKSKLGGI